MHDLLLLELLLDRAREVHQLGLGPLDGGEPGVDVEVVLAEDLRDHEEEVDPEGIADDVGGPLARVGLVPEVLPARRLLDAGVGAVGEADAAPEHRDARVADQGLRIHVLDIRRERLVALLEEAALARDREGRLVAEDDVERRVVGTGRQQLRHPLGGDAGDDLDLHPVRLLERLDEGLLHHFRPAAAVAGDDERLRLGVRARNRHEWSGQDRDARRGPGLPDGDTSRDRSWAGLRGSCGEDGHRGIHLVEVDVALCLTNPTDYQGRRSFFGAAVSTTRRPRRARQCDLVCCSTLGPPGSVARAVMCPVEPSRPAVPGGHGRRR